MTRHAPTRRSRPRAGEFLTPITSGWNSRLLLVQNEPLPARPLFDIDCFDDDARSCSMCGSYAPGSPPASLARPFPRSDLEEKALEPFPDDFGPSTFGLYAPGPGDFAFLSSLAFFCAACFAARAAGPVSTGPSASSFFFAFSPPGASSCPVGGMRRGGARRRWSAGRWLTDGRTDRRQNAAACVSKSVCFLATRTYRSPKNGAGGL